MGNLIGCSNCARVMGRIVPAMKANRTMRFAWLVLLVLAGLSPAAAATAIGKVSRVQGEAVGTVEGLTRPISADDPVYLDEHVSTGANARLELTFDDRTVLTVGERATLRLDEFVYRPDANVVKVTLAGAFRFVSSPVQGVTRDMGVTTPFAVIAVRGTDFWGGPIDGVFGVVLFDGAVAVANVGVTIDLDVAGQGVNIPGPGVPPGPATVWAADRVARAVATVTFQ
jgi:hypothetical protein